MCICMYVEIAVEARCVRFPWSCTCRQLWTARCGLEEEQALLLSHLFRPLPQLSKRKAAWAWRMLKLGWREGVPGTTAFFSFWLGGAVPSILLLLSTTAGVYPFRQNPRSATNFQYNLADALRCPGSHFWNRCVYSWCRVTEKNPDAPYEWKPRAQLANTRETCSFKYSRKLADIPRTMARNISDVMAWVIARTHSWMSHMQVKWTAPHTSAWSVCHASMSLLGYLW